MLSPSPCTPSSGMSTLRAPLLDVKMTALINAIARKSRLHSSFRHAGSSRFALQNRGTTFLGDGGHDGCLQVAQLQVHTVLHKGATPCRACHRPESCIQSRLRRCARLLIRLSG